MMLAALGLLCASSISTSAHASLVEQAVERDGVVELRNLNAVQNIRLVMGAISETVSYVGGMSKYDPSNASCTVHTFKDGLLSKVAHDLKLEFQSFSLDVADDHASLEATFDLASLKTVCACKDGSDNLGALSDSDKGKIDKNMADDVLHTKRHGEARFIATEVTADGEGFLVTGDLSLHGETRSITAKVERRGDRFVTDLALNQPDFGIQPFSAMMGTLKVKPEVRVELSVPAS